MPVAKLWEALGTHMPSTFLTRSQLAAIDVRMERRQAKLSAEVRTRSDESVPPTEVPNLEPRDAGERGEARTRETARHTEKERDIAELRQIAEARKRMQEGSYGICVVCSRLIPMARLEVQPFCARCVPCQEEFELRRGAGSRLPASL